MAEIHESTLLVTGASGQLGRQIVELLLEMNIRKIIATTRSPENVADLADRGVIVRYANFDDPASLKVAFEGADRLLLISTDELSVPGKRLQQHKNAVEAAQESEVQHILYTSIIEPVDSSVLFAPDHLGTEQAIAESSMGWSILRNSLYMDLLLASLPQAYQMGGIYNASGEGKIAYVTREDCARAAAAALASSFEGQRVLNITGPEALSQIELAQIASNIIGKPLNYVPISLDAVIQGMLDAGLPKPAAETYASIDEATAKGQFESVSDDFEDLTGNKPTSVSEFLTAHKSEIL